LIDKSELERTTKIQVENILHSRLSGKSYGTPHLNGRSLLGKIQSTSRTQLKFQSKFKLGRSVTLLDDAVTSIASNHPKSFSNFLHTSKSDDSILMGISDNHNISKKQRIGPNGTEFVDGMNTLVKSLSYPCSNTTTSLSTSHSSFIPISLSTPFITPVNINLLIDFIKGLPPSYLDPYFQDTKFEVNLDFPHLSSFNPHPFTPAKSSSKKDIDKHLMKNIMEDELEVGIRPAALVVDPEPFNLVMGMIHSDPRTRERWRYMIPVIGLFHLRMHFCAGTLLDPSNYLLIWNRLLPLMMKSSFKVDWVRMKIEAFRRFNSDSLPAYQNTIKLVKHFLIEETKEDSKLPTGTDVVDDLLNHHEDGDDASFTDKKMMGIFHLLYLIGNESNGKCWNTKRRNQFSYEGDPKRNIRILRTVYHCWKEIETEIGDIETGVGVDALKSVIEEIGLLVVPFDDLFLTGDASTLFASLPKIIAKLSYDHHPKLLSGYLPFLHLLNDWKDTNPGIISFISYYFHNLNDGLIENFNSTITYSYGKHGQLSAEGIASSIAQASQKMRLRDQLGWEKNREAECKSEYVQIYNNPIKEKVKTELMSIFNDCRSGEKYCMDGISLMGDKYAVGMNKMITHLEKMENPVAEDEVYFVDIINGLQPYIKDSLIECLQRLQNENVEVRIIDII